MHSRVAAVMAPCTHNRRRVTGSSGRRREGGESEPQRPNMSRHLFTSAVLLLLVVLVCCSTGGATKAEVKSGDFQLPQAVDVLVLRRTQVLVREGTESGVKDLYGVPSLVNDGGVMAVPAQSIFSRDLTAGAAQQVAKFDIVAMHLNSSSGLSSRFAEVDNSTLRAHTVLGNVDEMGAVTTVPSPKTVLHGNNVFLIARTEKLN
ncbi:trans-sialidase [Trypanosoma cruzi]|nr:trans-sialidase [Trypanosoma cruzi]